MHIPGLGMLPFTLSTKKVPIFEGEKPKINFIRIIESVIIVALTTGALKITSIDSLSTKVSDLQTMEVQREQNDVQRSQALEAQISRIHREIARIRSDVYVPRGK